MEEITGNRYGRLVVGEYVETGKRGRMFHCQCDCGNTAEFAYRDLKRSNHKSCGCLNHGMSRTRIHHSWANMKRRCNDPKNKMYHRYGGRGITYDPRWEEFTNFYEDMKEGYADHLTLDREDNNGNYNKENCRWADKLTQANNASSNVLVTYEGETLTLAQMARKHGVKWDLFTRNYHKNGLSLEESLKRSKKEKETIVHNGIEKTVSEWAAEYGMTYHQLKKRLMRDWDIDRALTQPLRERRG